MPMVFGRFRLCALPGAAARAARPVSPRRSLSRTCVQCAGRLTSTVTSTSHPRVSRWTFGRSRTTTPFRSVIFPVIRPGSTRAVQAGRHCPMAAVCARAPMGLCICRTAARPGTATPSACNAAVPPPRQNRTLPHALAADRGGHRPLRGAPKDEHGICPGTAGSFSIKRNLELGHALRTAVVEVQLYGCRDADTARAIAVALREACAIELGIEPDEMGFAATPALTPEGTEAWCAVVYDRASGGAGFAATIADEPIRCLNVARDLLDCAGPGGCGQPGAERFCPRCLLSADTQHMIERCDRLTAFQVLDDLVPRLEIAAEDRLFGAGTELQSMP